MKNFIVIFVMLVSFIPCLIVALATVLMQIIWLDLTLLIAKICHWAGQTKIAIRYLECGQMITGRHGTKEQL